MSKIKLEHIDNLRRGKKSWARIGSGAVPHHLYKYEEEKYRRAMKNKYLEITTQDRVNLENLWEKVCIAKKWKYTIIRVEARTLLATLFQDGKMLAHGEKKYIRKIAQNYV